MMQRISNHPTQVVGVQAVVLDKRCVEHVQVILMLLEELWQLGDVAEGRPPAVHCLKQDAPPWVMKHKAWMKHVLWKRCPILLLFLLLLPWRWSVACYVSSIGGSWAH